MKKSEKELNAIVKCEKEGHYFNLKLVIPTQNGETIDLMVKPIYKDKSYLNRLLYKIYKVLGDK